MWSTTQRAAGNPDDNPEGKPPQLTSWHGHQDSVVSVEYLSRSQGALLLSASKDCTARLWTLDGQYIGMFGQVSCYVQIISVLLWEGRRHLAWWLVGVAGGPIRWRMCNELRRRMFRIFIEFSGFSFPTFVCNMRFFLFLGRGLIFVYLRIFYFVLQKRLWNIDDPSSYRHAG